MSFRLRLLCIGITWVLASYGQQNLAPNTPVSFFKFPRFHPETGYVVWDVQGSKGQYIDETHILVEKLVLRNFSGDEEVTLESTLTSEQAVIDIAEENAVGEGKLHIESPNFEIKGTGWNWDGPSKTITVKKNVEVFLPQGFINILD